MERKHFFNIWSSPQTDLVFSEIRLARGETPHYTQHTCCPYPCTVWVTVSRLTLNPSDYPPTPSICRDLSLHRLQRPVNTDSVILRSSIQGPWSRRVLYRTRVGVHSERGRQSEEKVSSPPNPTPPRLDKDFSYLSRNRCSHLIFL